MWLAASRFINGLGPGRNFADRSAHSRTRIPIPAVASLLVAAAGALVPAGPGFAQTVDQNLWVTNGYVATVVHDAGTVYIGGEFTWVGPSTGGGLPIDPANGDYPNAAPKVVGGVHAVLSDGAGGWYIGGGFSSVGGLPRSNLAHVGPDLSVTDWAPETNRIVRAMAMIGSTVYVGGDFSTVGGQVRNGLAAVDATAGAVSAWNPNANDDVLSLAVSGTTVYAGGQFERIGGQPRNHIAALDATTGLATAWNPNVTGSDLSPPRPAVTALAVSGSTVYAGGWFSGIGGEARNHIAALDVTTGAATAWNPDAEDGVSVLAVNDSTIYTGGWFREIGGKGRKYIAALDAATGVATAWNPNPSSYVHAIAVDGSTVYAGGRFTSIGGQSRSRVAALDATTGLATGWKPDPNNFVYALAVNRSFVYVGGWFTSVGGLARANIAALDATTGAATAWNPGADHAVIALAKSGSTVYAGGYFANIGGQARYCIAALDAETGLASSWNPNPSGSPSFSRTRVVALAVKGSTVYAGGDFGAIGGQARTNLAALDAATGAATAWNPSPNNRIYELAASDTRVYAAGHFTNIDGQSCEGLAGLDPMTGSIRWNPGADRPVHALALSGSVVYAGGEFSRIGGQTRNHVAALDATSGLATAWNPDADNSVLTLAVSGSNVYVGGFFATIGGQPRSRLAALNATTGEAIAHWDPNPRFTTHGIIGLATNGPTVYVGGDYQTIGGLGHSYISAIEAPDVPTPTLLSLFSERVTHNGVELTWHAPAGDISEATIYRRIAGSVWEALAQISANGTGHLSYHDTRVIAGTRYGYRLGVVEGAGNEVFLGETWVDVPAAPELALVIRSNPTPSDLSVSFSLPNDSRARLELFDIGGRRIASREVGTLGPGSHEVALGDGRRFAPGVYLLRLSQGTRSITARAAILQ